MQAALSLSTPRTINLQKDPYIPVGWTVEEHHRDGMNVWDPNNVHLYLYHHQITNAWCPGPVIRGHLKELPVLNANMLDFLIGHPELIPKGWGRYYVHFWGTIYLGPHGSTVRFLYRSGSSWSWNHVHLSGINFPADAPAAVRIA